MARGARLLITVGRGGVRSVRSKNKSYVGQSKKRNALLFRDEVVLSCDNKKESKNER